MTTKQRNLYWKVWSKAFRAHWSGTQAGEVLVRPGRPQSKVRDQVVAAAQAWIVRQGGGPLTADALRHACHILAVGRDISSWQLTNKALDQVLAQFRLLADEATLAADIALTCARSEPRRRADGQPLPDADANRVAYALRDLDLPKAYLEELCMDRFGVRDWVGLDEAQRYQLLITAKARSVARRIAFAKRPEHGQPVGGRLTPV